jgi:hypothetical protein
MSYSFPVKRPLFVATLIIGPNWRFVENVLIIDMVSIKYRDHKSGYSLAFKKKLFLNNFTLRRVRSLGYMSNVVKSIASHLFDACFLLISK